MATINRVLGKHNRLFIGNTATPVSDADYTKVSNENSISVKGSADLQENDTKEAGKISNPGTVSWELSGDFNEIFEDAGLALLEEAFNTPWMYQIRDTSVTPNKVWLEGEFILSDLEYTSEATDARSGTYTLKNSSEVTRNRPTRALGNTTP
jgi:predicted secreted protein